jgi:hypothetical protein
MEGCLRFDITRIVAVVSQAKGLHFAIPVRASDLAGGGVLDRIDSLDVNNLVRWRNDRVAQRLADWLGIVPRRRICANMLGIDFLEVPHAAIKRRRVMDLTG